MEVVVISTDVKERQVDGVDVRPVHVRLRENNIHDRISSVSMVNVYFSPTINRGCLFINPAELFTCDAVVTVYVGH